MKACVSLVQGDLTALDFTRGGWRCRPHTCSVARKSSVECECGLVLACKHCGVLYPVLHPVSITQQGSCVCTQPLFSLVLILHFVKSVVQLRPLSVGKQYSARRIDSFFKSMRWLRMTGSDFCWNVTAGVCYPCAGQCEMMHVRIRYSHLHSSW